MKKVQSFSLFEAKDEPMEALMFFWEIAGS
jgi:hypothetical protein